MNHSNTNQLQHTRRGNSLILVTAILVLLVIIASAYITRVQGTRITGASQQYMQGREAIATNVANDLATSIAEALFARPFNYSAGAPERFLANTPRLPIPQDSVRHGPNLIDLNNGVRFNLGQNEVIPWTNWPDAGLPIFNPALPATDGRNRYPDGTVADPILADLGEYNPIGDPGTNDARWLADLEPQRFVLPGFDGLLGTADDITIFSHWRHMSYIAHANNGYRLCKDISDVTGAVTFANQSIGGGGVLTDLSLPVEQFLAIRPGGVGASAVSAAGLPCVPGNFFERFSRWFSSDPTQGYVNSFTDPEWIPPTFLQLSDLNGDGIKFNWNIGGVPQESMQSEFIRGTARNLVSRVLCDTDGDGFTDSYWFLAPTSIDRSVRTIVGVRVIDNNGMANVNVATRFVPSEDSTQFLPDSRTKGTTPADLAFVGHPTTPPIGFPQVANLNNYSVGFCDSPNHSVTIPGAAIDSVNYYLGTPSTNPLMYWQRHIQQVGLLVPTLGIGAWSPTQAQRMIWWLDVGVEGPYTPYPQSGFTPFTVADELELRMFHGNNNPWSFSRLEYALTATDSTANTLMHAGVQHEESSEYLDQRSNRGLVIDKRRLVTTYNATRNDLLPPWLWPSGRLPNELHWSQLNPTARQLAMQKVDLRAQSGNYNRDNFLNADDQTYLYQVLRRCLLDPDAVQSYYGITPTALISANRMAASLAANIKAYSDTDANAPLAEAVRIDLLPGQANPGGELRAYGMEKQPFLVEAMIGHVYHAGTQAINNHPSDDNGAPIQTGDWIVCGDSDHTTFVVVQLANPYDSPIVLSNSNPAIPMHEHFEVEVFGQSFDLSQLTGATTGPGAPQVVLPPATNGTPTTLTLVLMDDDLGGAAFEDTMARTLGLDQNNIIYIDVEPFGVWSTDRARYDAGLGAQAATTDGVQLVRVVADPFKPGGGVARVVIDRFDPPPPPVGSPPPAPGAQPAFRAAVTRLNNTEPSGDCSNEPGDGVDWPGVINVTAGANPASRYWAQWAHVKRAWGIRPEMKWHNPRYIFASHEVTTGEEIFALDSASPQPRFTFGSDPAFPARFNHDNNANGYPDKDFAGGNENLEFALQMLQKDGEFEQVGELLNVFGVSHELLITNSNGYEKTVTTFAEAMQAEVQRLGNSPLAERVRVGRLNPYSPKSVMNGSPLAVMPSGVLPQVIPPALPAAMRVLEAFTLDGPGVNPVPAPPPPPAVQIPPAFRLAHAFTGLPVHGLININTAPVEVLRMLPFANRIIHADSSGASGLNLSDMPRSALAEAIVQARELYNGNDSPVNGLRTGFPKGPDYTDRRTSATGAGFMRGGRGFAVKGELLTLNEEGTGNIVEFNNLSVDQKTWSFELAADEPFKIISGLAGVESSYISTDVTLPNAPDAKEGDGAAADAEEHNLLFAGMSNLITTTSDTFTVYFRVRSFRQNPQSGVWDATDPEYIIDDSRYVMLVDRSRVNSPADKPRIIYLEKLPN